ncbi:hypothetical protein [Hydrogenimonas sp.]
MAPTRDEAKHLLRELPYEAWLKVGYMFPPKGISRRKAGSLRELMWTLQPSAKSLPTVRLEVVARWLREKVGDAELAMRIEAIHTGEGSYAEKCYLAYQAIKARHDELAALAQGGDDA